MRLTSARLYVHLVFATWDRLPLIQPEVEERLYGALAFKCNELRCPPLAIGGVEDHVHLLVRLHNTIAIADLLKEIKGSSSRFINRDLSPGRFFKWQGSYGATSVSERHIPTVESYILHQKDRHIRKELYDELERTSEDILRPDA